MTSALVDKDAVYSRGNTEKSGRMCGNSTWDTEFEMSMKQPSRAEESIDTQV